MTPSDLDRLLDILCYTADGQPSSEVVALLDAAREPRIVPVLKQATVDSCCLYAGSMPTAIEEVAPYLVALERGTVATARLIDLTWGNGAAVFVHSTASRQDLRRHFRRFLRVRDEGGKSYIFRFYDPRVLRPFLQVVPGRRAASLLWTRRAIPDRVGRWGLGAVLRPSPIGPGVQGRRFERERGQRRGRKDEFAEARWRGESGDRLAFDHPPRAVPGPRRCGSAADRAEGVATPDGPPRQRDRGNRTGRDRTPDRRPAR